MRCFSRNRLQGKGASMRLAIAVFIGAVVVFVACSLNPVLGRQNGANELQLELTVHKTQDQENAAAEERGPQQPQDHNEDVVVDARTLVASVQSLVQVGNRLYVKATLSGHELSLHGRLSRAENGEFQAVFQAVLAEPVEIGAGDEAVVVMSQRQISSNVRIGMNESRVVGGDKDRLIWTLTIREFDLPH